MVSTAVVAHTDRADAAIALTDQLGAILCLDDEHVRLGAEQNHRRAWKATLNQPAEWSMVIEDDAEPVAGFEQQLQLALAAAPAPIVSFYLGTSRPPQFQPRIRQALSKANQTGAHWAIGRHMLHAVCIAIRQDLVPSLLAHTGTLPADEHVSAWARQQRHLIAHAIPSLVDHTDGPTLIDHRDGKPRSSPRRAWRTGTRRTWNSRTVLL